MNTTRGSVARVRALGMAAVSVVVLAGVACAGSMREEPASAVVASDHVDFPLSSEQRDAVIYIVDPEAPLTVLMDEIAADRQAVLTESERPPLVSIMVVGTGETRNQLYAELSHYLPGTSVLIIDLRRPHSA